MNLSNLGPGSISMCTNCRHMVPTLKMQMSTTAGKFLCPECSLAEKQQQLGAREEKYAAKLDPEMQKLKDRLENAS